MELTGYVSAPWIKTTLTGSRKEQFYAGGRKLQSRNRAKQKSEREETRKFPTTEMIAIKAADPALHSSLTSAFQFSPFSHRLSEGCTSLQKEERCVQMRSSTRLVQAGPPTMLCLYFVVTVAKKTAARSRTIASLAQ